MCLAGTIIHPDATVSLFIFILRLRYCAGDFGKIGNFPFRAIADKGCPTLFRRRCRRTAPCPPDRRHAVLGFLPFHLLESHRQLFYLAPFHSQRFAKFEAKMQVCMQNSKGNYDLGFDCSYLRHQIASNGNQDGRMPIAPDAAARYIHCGMSLGRNNQTWHEIVDDRSLEMDRVIAEKIRANPKLIQIALTNIERWLANPDYSESSRQAVLEWKSIIENSPVGSLATLLESSSDEARRLRQSSPFCGILTPDERQAIFQKYEALRDRACLAGR